MKKDSAWWNEEVKLEVKKEIFFASLKKYRNNKNVVMYKELSSRQKKQIKEKAELEFWL